MIQSPDLVPENPADRRDGRHVVLVADALGQKSIPDFPGKYSRILLLQVSDKPDDLRGRNSGLTAANGSGQNGPGFIVSGQNFRDASVADSELS